MKKASKQVKSNKEFSNQKKIDLALLLIYPLAAVFLALILQANLLVGGILFFAIPSVYLSFRIKEKIIKALGFSLIISVFLEIIVDYMGYLDKSWSIPSTAFSIRIFGVIPLEDPIWIFLVTYELVLIYEYFFNPKAKSLPRNKKRMYIMLIASVLIFVGFMLIKTFLPNVLYVPYFYFIWGITIILIPCVAFLFFHRKLITRFFTLSLYTFYVGILTELVSLRLDYWEFPGKNFIGWVTILGLTFPIEEFMLFLMFVPPAFLTYYEFFDDDEK